MIALHKITLLYRWLALVLAGLGIAFAPAPRLQLPAVERHFRVEASSFQYDPGIIAVNPGDKVTIDLVSTDYVHGFKIDGYNLEVTADPGQTKTLTFVADREGSFRVRCSVPCGPAHPFMIGKLNVGPNWLFYRAIGLAFLAIAAALWAIHP